VARVLQAQPRLERDQARELLRDFERLPHFEDAVRLRRYDDVGKDPSLATDGVERYRLLLESLLVG
jgi:predicted HD phosphohydrolase